MKKVTKSSERSVHAHTHTAVPVVKYVRDDDGEEAEEQHCSAGIDHRVEHPHSDGCGVGEVRHLLERNHTQVEVSFLFCDSG